MSSNFTFHATVAEEVMSKVTRLFNATLSDIYSEIFQNARRANAETIVIDQIDDPELGPCVCIADDGRGLENPQSMFSLGRSAWDQKVYAIEDAAGMGFFSLASRGARIIAQRQETENAWVIEASPAAFSGTEPVFCSDGPIGHCGVTIIIPVAENEDVKNPARVAARFCPLAITIDGELVASKDFLADAILVEEWKGIRIGIYERSPCRWYNEKNINFYGVTLRAGLPFLDQTFGPTLYVKIDVTRCSDLKLVLPARKEIVQDDFFQELKIAILTMLYGMISRRPHHSLSFEDYKEGRSLGIKLKEAVSCLRPFTPNYADCDRREKPAPEQVGGKDFLFASPEDSIADQNFARSLERQSTDLKFFDPCAAFTGYRWYDALARAIILGYRISTGDQMQEISLEERVTVDGRPDQIQVLLEYHKSKKVCPLEFETDLLILGEDYDGIDEVDVHVTKSSKVTPNELAAFIEDALFCPADSSEAGSYDQQQEWFQDEAEDFAITLLRSGADAELGAILRIIERKLLWHLPRDRRVLIDITGSNIIVRGLEAADSPAIEETPGFGRNS